MRMTVSRSGNILVDLSGGGHTFKQIPLTTPINKIKVRHSRWENYSGFHKTELIKFRQLGINTLKDFANISERMIKSAMNKRYGYNNKSDLLTIIKNTSGCRLSGWPHEMTVHVPIPSNIDISGLSQEETQLALIKFVDEKPDLFFAGLIEKAEEINRKKKEARLAELNKEIEKLRGEIKELG